VLADKVPGPPKVREWARNAAIEGLYWSRDAWRGNAVLSKPSVRFLLMHDFADGQISALRQLIGMLRRHFEIVSYSDAVECVLEGRIDRPRIALSFDDGLLGCYKAAEVLHGLAVSACFFVCPAVAGNSDPVAVRKFARERLHRDNAEFMGWGHLERLLALGHEVGSHTESHQRLSTLALSDAIDDLQRSLQTIRDRLGACQHFAWPYGRFSDFSRPLLESAYRVGYESCASGERGAHSAKPPDSFLCIRRNHIEVSWRQTHMRHFLIHAAAMSNGGGLRDSW
jgi:hypothetical protein